MHIGHDPVPPKRRKRKEDRDEHMVYSQYKNTHGNQILKRERREKKNTFARRKIPLCDLSEQSC